MLFVKNTIDRIMFFFFRIRDRSRMPNLHQRDRWPISGGQGRQPPSGRFASEAEQHGYRRPLTQGKQLSTLFSGHGKVTPPYALSYLCQSSR